MAKVAIINDDKKLSSTIDRTLKDLEIESLEIIAYNSFREFEAGFFASSLKMDHGGSLDLILINHELVKTGFAPKIQELRDRLKKWKWYPADCPTRIVVLKYEDDANEKINLATSLINDLIYLPIDRLSFLQKMDILIKLPKKTTPKYLFSQNTKVDIEISKIMKLELISDVGFAVRNPVALKSGLLAHFFIQFPAQEEILSVYGKSISSESHPEIEGAFLVYFSFFGIQKNDLTEVRRFLAADSRFKKFKDENKEHFKLNTEDIFLTEEDKEPRSVMVIDFDPHRAQSIKETLEGEIDNLQVIHEPSLSVFFKKHIETRLNKKSGNEDLVSAVLADIAEGEIAFLVEKNTMDLLSVEGEIPSRFFLGHKISEISDSKTFWRIFFKGGETEALLGDIVEHIKADQPVDMVMKLTNSEHKSFAVKCLFSEATSNEVLIKFAVADEAEIKKRFFSDDGFRFIDALIIDGGQVSGDSRNIWAESVAGQMKEAGLIGPSGAAFFFSGLSAETDITGFNSPYIKGAFTTPTDSRLLAFGVANAIKGTNSIHTLANTGFAQIFVNVHAGKKAELKQIAEYGATIRHPAPIASGHYFYLRNSIFDKAPNQNLCARVYDCTEDPEEKGTYLVSVLYFGIADGFMKEARSWFRETYAASKSGG